MTVKTLTLSDGRTLRFGRKQPVIRYPILSLGNYLLANTLPPIPASIDYSTGCATALTEMYNNDTLGDCVIACVEHCEGVLTGDASDNNTTTNSSPLLFTSNQTISFYSAACGYVPGNSGTDQGCDIQTVLHYWENNGSPKDSNHKIVGILAVDPANTVECQTAVWLFENLIFGVDMPDAWINPEPRSSGFVWDVAGNPDNQNGHCFLGLGYDASGVKISTWGMTGTVTYPAIAKYAASNVYGELYVVISQDQLNSASQLAPNGLNWTQLVADFQALGGTVSNTTPVPVPNTTPNTTPTPVPNTTPNTTPTPSGNSVGSAQWLHDNLAPEDYQNLINVYKAIEHYNPEVDIVSSAGWLKAHLSANAYSDLYNSITTL